jgi:predicted RNA-binding Zn-ribbon protein involved in translation (DUF1610 family)
MDPNFRYCLAEGCNFGQIHDSGHDGNIYRCGECGFRVCTVHDVPFHTDETCDEYTERIEAEREGAKPGAKEARLKREQERMEQEQERLEQERLEHEQEQASLNVVSKTSVECPGCHAKITKTDGCDHMTCEYHLHRRRAGMLMSTFQVVTRDVGSSSATSVARHIGAIMAL